MNNYLPVIVGISGASGTIYGLRLIEVLKQLKIPVIAVISEAARKVAYLENCPNFSKIVSEADFVYEPADISAPIASGSFKTQGMVVAPCSIKSLSSIANSYSDNLLTRSADVCLKERRKLILLVRETPLHSGHIALMLKTSKMGAVILPPMPAFYHQPATIEDIIDQTIGKTLDLLDINHDLFKRWGDIEYLKV